MNWRLIWRLKENCQKAKQEISYAKIVIRLDLFIQEKNTILESYQMEGNPSHRPVQALLSTKRETNTCTSCISIMHEAETLRESVHKSHSDTKIT